jgi:glutathione-independent formaldehyde dehydrogenase
MKAVVYQGPFKVAVEDVDDPRIEHPNDVVVRITSSAICGSDLHMYEGRTAAEPGIVFGHENLGIVEEVGATVTSMGAPTVMWPWGPYRGGQAEYLRVPYADLNCLKLPPAASTRATSSPARPTSSATTGSCPT